jgi:hypothetical protein
MPPAPEPSSGPPPPPRSWRERLRSPTVREIAIGLAIPLIGGLIAFSVRALWGVIHEPEATGTIEYKGTTDEFVSREDFYRRFVHAPAPASSANGMGAVFLVSTSAHHASRCRFEYTALNVGDGQTVGDLADMPIPDVAGGSRCGGEKRVWIQWPCVVSETLLQFEIDLIAGSKRVSTLTKTFPMGGGC